MPFLQYLALAAVALFALSSAAFGELDPELSHYECQNRLKSASKKLVEVVGREGPFPTSQADLPKEVSRLLGPCPYSPEVAIFPYYLSSSNGGHFAIYCSGDHSFMHRGPQEFAGVVYEPSAVGSPSFYRTTGGGIRNCDIDYCKKMISKKVAYVEDELAKTSELPTLLPILDSKTYHPCDYNHSLISKPEGDYEIICTSLCHIREGIQPLQPRYLSSESEFVAFQLMEAPQAPPTLSDKSKFIFVFTITIVIALIFWRRKVNPSNRVIPRKPEL